MSQNSSKFYPPASQDIARLLGLDRDLPGPSAGPAVMAVPQGITVVEAELQETSQEAIPAGNTAASINKMTGVFYVLKIVLPYMAIFAIGVLLYYFYFADPSNRPELATKTEQELQQEQVKTRQAQLQAIQSQQSKAYTAWINQFYFAVSDARVVAPDTLAVNGLTNFENYLLGLNPKMYDALGNGKSDAENVLNGVNPKTGGSLTENQRDMVAQYFDTDAIRTRLASLAPINDQTGDNQDASEQGTVAGSSTGIRGLEAGSNRPAQSTQSTPASNNLQNGYNINTSIPGRLEIPSIDVNVPIIWTTDPKNFDNDLKSGVVHYPGTPLPGDIGTAYISGHSSNYAWVKADYNRIFRRMNELPVGASFKVTVVNKQGEDVRLHYTVENKLEFKADDQAQFLNYAYSRVALSTCWPIDTVERRLVAFGRLVKVD